MPALAAPQSILMSLTSMENSIITQPQNTNTAGRVFGGFLLHKAFDLAHATCYTFSGKYPFFKEVDEVAFKRPVDIGDLIRLKSRVVYTQQNPPLVQVEVKCLIIQPEKASSKVSNTFDFVFGFEDGCGDDLSSASEIKPNPNWSLKEVVASNHEEATTMITAYKGRRFPEDNI